MKRNYLVRAGLIGTLLMLFVTSTMAQRDDRATKTEDGFAVNFSVNEANPQKLMVNVRNPAGEKLSMDVYSSEEGCLLSREVYGPVYHGCLDFSTATDGDYRVEIRGRDRTIVKKICIKTRDISSRELAVE